MDLVEEATKINVAGILEHLPVYHRATRNNILARVLELVDLVLDLVRRGLKFRFHKTWWNTFV